MATNRFSSKWGRMLDVALVGYPFAFAVVALLSLLAEVVVGGSGGQSGGMGGSASIDFLITVLPIIAVIFSIVLSISLYKDAKKIVTSRTPVSASPAEEWNPPPTLYAVGGFLLPLIGYRYLWRRYQLVSRPSDGDVGWWYFALAISAVSVLANFIFLPVNPVSQLGSQFTVNLAISGLLAATIYLDARYLQAVSVKNDGPRINPASFLLGMFVLGLFGFLYAHLPLLGYYAYKRRQIVGLFQTRAQTVTGPQGASESHPEFGGPQTGTGGRSSGSRSPTGFNPKWGRRLEMVLVGYPISLAVLALVGVSLGEVFHLISEVPAALPAPFILVPSAAIIILGVPVVALLLSALLGVSLYMDASAMDEVSSGNEGKRSSASGWQPSPRLYAIGGFVLPLIGFHYMWRRYQLVSRPTRSNLWWYLTLGLAAMSLLMTVLPFVPGNTLLLLDLQLPASLTIAGLISATIYMDARYVHDESFDTDGPTVNPVNYLFGMFIFALLGTLLLTHLIVLAYYAYKRRKIVGLI